MSPLSSMPPCAACKFQRRKCIPECIFAPYFPPEEQEKFICVHKVFGASNVSKILSDIAPNLRADAARSLIYEAEYRLREPVYGCVGLVAHLQERLQQLQVHIANANMELAGLNNVVTQLPQPSSLSQHYAYGSQMMFHHQDPSYSASSSLPYTSLIPFPSMGMCAGPSTQQYGVGPSRPVALGVNIGSQFKQDVGDDEVQQGLGLHEDQVVVKYEENKHAEQVLETSNKDVQGDDRHALN